MTLVCVRVGYLPGQGGVPARKEVGRYLQKLMDTGFGLNTMDSCILNTRLKVTRYNLESSLVLLFRPLKSCGCSIGNAGRVSDLTLITFCPRLRHCLTPHLIPWALSSLCLPVTDTILAVSCCHGHYPRCVLLSRTLSLLSLTGTRQQRKEVLIVQRITTLWPFRRFHVNVFHFRNTSFSLIHRSLK